MNTHKVERSLIGALCFFLSIGHAPHALAEGVPEILHAHGDQLELTPEGGLYEGRVRLLHESLQIFAPYLQIHKDHGRARGDGQWPVRLQSAAWSLTAQSLSWQNLLSSPRGEVGLSIRPHWQAEQAVLKWHGAGVEVQTQVLVGNAERWRFEGLQVHIPGIPGYFQAETGYYLPLAESLSLHDVRYFPVEGQDWAITWPNLQWQLTEMSPALRLRPDFWGVQPHLRWGSPEEAWQGLDVGAQFQLWQTASQRAYGGLYYGGVTGWRTTGALEWRPHDAVTVLARGQWQERQQNSPTALTTAALDYYQALDGGLIGGARPLWLQAGLRWQDADRFLQGFGLPIQPTPTTQTGAELLLMTSPETAFEGRFEHMAMLGIQGGVQNRLSGLWRGDMALGQWLGQRFWGSFQSHVLYTPAQGWSPTLGLRFTDVVDWSTDFRTGLYVEDYFSTLPANWFWRGYLSPALGGFVQWQGQHLALTADTALNLMTGEWRQLNVLSSWRYENLFLHLGWMLQLDNINGGEWVGGPRLSVQWVLPTSETN